MNDAFERWQQAQDAEQEFWSGLARQDEAIHGVLEDNRRIAEQVEQWLPARPGAALEIGIGGLGVGTIGFLGKIPLRVAIDPLPIPELSCNENLHGIIEQMREPIQFHQSEGEHVPFADASFDLVLCCNVLDHVRDPAAVLQEAYRIMRPGAYFYLLVDVFSLAGVVKWKFWTQYKSRHEILVRAHPHRFRERKLPALIQGAGLRVVREDARSVWQNLFAHSKRHAILAEKKEMS